MGIIIKARRIPWAVNGEQRSFTLNDLVYEPRTEPRILYSPYLSGLTGLEVSILDCSCTDTGTHKFPDAIDKVGEAKEKGKRIIFHLNSKKPKSHITRGSMTDALDLASAIYYPESQLITFVHSTKPYFKRTPVHRLFPNSRQNIEAGIDLNKFWGDDELAEHLYISMYNEDIVGAKDVKDFLISRGINPMDQMEYIYVTNLFDTEKESRLQYSPELMQQLTQFSYLVGSVGIGKRAWYQIKSLKSGKPIHILVAPVGHPTDPDHNYQDSVLERLKTPYGAKVQEELLKESERRDDVLWKFISNPEAAIAKVLFADKVVQDEHTGMRTSVDGAAAFSILKSRYEPSHQGFFSEDGMRILDTYKVVSGKDGWQSIDKGIIIPYGSLVCVVNTGNSRDYLKYLIMRGVLK